MKHLFFILIFPAYIFGQIPDETSQIKISYSMEYKKVPFKMKMFKKIWPKLKIFQILVKIEGFRKFRQN